MDSLVLLMQRLTGQQNDSHHTCHDQVHREAAAQQATAIQQLQTATATTAQQDTVSQQADRGSSHTCRSAVTRYMILVPGRVQLAVLVAPHALPAWYSATGTYMYSPSVSIPVHAQAIQPIQHANDQGTDLQLANRTFA